MSLAMLVPLEGGHVVNHLPMPTIMFFVVTFVLLLVALWAIMGIGKSRPHS